MKAPSDTPDTDRAKGAHEVLHLDAEDSRVFVTALLNPPAPSERMRALATRYKHEVEER